MPDSLVKRLSKGCIFICNRKECSLESGRKSQMSIQSRVLNALESWCGTRPDQLSVVLKDLWNDTAPGSAHSSLDFDPDGIDALIQELHDEFSDQPQRQVTLIAGDFRSAGKIQTAQQLVNEAATFSPIGAPESAVEPLPQLAGKVSLTRQAKKRKMTTRPRKLTGAKSAKTKTTASRKKRRG